MAYRTMDKFDTAFFEKCRGYGAREDGSLARLNFRWETDSYKKGEKRVHNLD